MDTSADSQFSGSSPRVWGTRRSSTAPAGGPRFIPTGVGNTPDLIEIDFQVSVHPHGCGEHHLVMEPLGVKFGSSPRVWGTLDAVHLLDSQMRFIPTGVGNTMVEIEPFCQAAVHPHGCGEHSLASFAAAKPAGSSPRVWGTPLTPGRTESIVRFIPTGVGNTFFRFPLHPNAPVHPHGCGEHKLGPVGPACYHGSSPRVWGTLIHGQETTRRCRFIPTGVGNTGGHSQNRLDATVHPHGCGEH